jgi:RNA polymerase sigma-70 factor, ECF subfamily
MVLQLKAGSEDAYACLIERYHASIYSLVYRLVNNAADAADTTQEVFIKAFRGMGRFNGSCSLRTWLYRIAIHEISNQCRWWSRHKARELSLDPQQETGTTREGVVHSLKTTLVCDQLSPFDSVRQLELRAQVEHELQQVREPYRTTIILRDLEELSYSEIAEVMQTCDATVRSRLARGRDLLKARLQQNLQCMSGGLPPTDLCGNQFDRERGNQ